MTSERCIIQEVFDVIDGRAEVRAHGPRVMPVWGRAFQITGGDRYGPGGELMVKGRILSLTEYLESLQAKDEHGVVRQPGGARVAAEKPDPRGANGSAFAARLDLAFLLGDE